MGRDAQHLTAGMIGMDQVLLGIQDQDAVWDGGQDRIQLGQLAVLFRHQQVGLVPVLDGPGGRGNQAQRVSMVTVDRHHQPKHPEQAPADIEDGCGCPGGLMELADKMLRPRHLDRHPFGQSQSNGGGPDQLLRQDRPAPGSPLIHDPENLFIPDQVEYASNAVC